MKISVSASLLYESRLWTEEFIPSMASFEWGASRATVGHGGAHIAVDVEVEEDLLREVLLKWSGLEPGFPPHWQTVPPEVQPAIVEIEQQVLDGARAFDSALRSVPGSIRLPPFKFSTAGPNPAQQWPVMAWSLTDEDRETFSDVLGRLDDSIRAQLSKRVILPTPPWNEGRFAELNDDDQARLRTTLEAGDATRAATPFQLWPAAWESFERRQDSAAVIVLAASIETGLKAFLADRGDGIARRLITDIPSPPVKKLFRIAQEECSLDLPDRFGSWLQQLSELRNVVAHRPAEEQPHRLEVARWFAIGEAILMRLNDDQPDDRVGELVEVSSENDAFAAGTRGVVLRRSVEHEGQESYHLFLESGDTRRFANLGVALRNQTIA